MHSSKDIVKNVEFIIRLCHKSTRFEKVSGLIGLWGPLGVDIYPSAFLKRMIPE